MSQELITANNIAFSDAEQAAMVQFEEALNFCIEGFQSGNDSVVLPHNIHERFGNMALQYFERNVANEVGVPVTLTLLSDGNGQQTLVQKPQVGPSSSPVEVQPLAMSQTSTSNQAPTKASTFRVTKKPPRPRNCWIIFRDNMYRRYKLEDSKISVHKISTLCSLIWAKQSTEEREFWNQAADAEAKEHARLHPGYKYNPRKPGEKKKRNSRKGNKGARKAKKAVTVQVSDIPSGSEVSMPAPSTTAPTATMTEPTPANVEDTFVDDLISFNEPVPAGLHGSLFGASVPFVEHPSIIGEELTGSSFNEPVPTNLHGSFLGESVPLHERPSVTGEVAAGSSCNEHYVAEALRQFLLEEEFEGKSTTDPACSFLNDDSFAFRTGADGNATLPSIYGDMF